MSHIILLYRNNDINNPIEASIDINLLRQTISYTDNYLDDKVIAAIAKVFNPTIPANWRQSYNESIATHDLMVNTTKNIAPGVTLEVEQISETKTIFTIRFIRDLRDKFDALLREFYSLNPKNIFFNQKS